MYFPEDDDSVMVTIKTGSPGERDRGKEGNKRTEKIGKEYELLSTCRFTSADFVKQKDRMNRMNDIPQPMR